MTNRDSVMKKRTVADKIQLKFSRMNLKSLAIAILILTNALSLYLIYTTKRSEFLVSKKNSFLHSQIRIAEALQKETPKYSVFVDCNKLTIKENFDKFYKWSIPVISTEFVMGDNYILFRNHSKNAHILKTWFPESKTSGGFGNSVSSSEIEYNLVLDDQNTVTRIMSHINALKEL